MAGNETIKTGNPYEEMARATRRPWEGYVPPFRMAPGVYYISGNDWVGAYLIETSEGLILIDTAMHETVYLLLENVRRLGYAPSDIKKILLSHAHIDHVGGVRTLKELTGAELYLGQRDMLFVTERKDLIGNDNGEHTCGDFKPDQLYEDGGQVRLGEIAITTVATPGHTPGCTSFFFDVKEKNGKTLRCGMHGGVGLNTMSSVYFRTSGLPATLRDEFAENLARLERMEVDVCMPSHPNQVEILSLVDRITENFNPYVNPQAWHTFLRDRLKKLRALIESDNQL